MRITKFSTIKQQEAQQQHSFQNKTKTDHLILMTQEFDPKGMQIHRRLKNLAPHQ